MLPLFGDDGLRIGDLTDRARIAKQSMTTLVRDAVSAGLVTREVDPEDGRSHRIWLTPRAMEFRAVADLILNEMTDRLIAVVDPESVEIVSRSLAAVKSLPLDNNS